MNVIRGLLAVVVALLPTRWWSRVDHQLGMRSVAWLSGVATMFVGFALGIPGFFRYAEAFTRSVELRVAASDDPLAFPNVLFGPLAPLNFALGTPLGLVATYLCVTGLLRAVRGGLDDPAGDPLLTLADRVVYGATTRVRALRARWARERLEGPELPDRLVTGRWAGVDAEYVLLATRRKPDWEEGVFLLTSDKWYCVGRAWDMPRPGGLCTAYPLTLVPPGEVLRKGVEYELPELSEVP